MDPRTCQMDPKYGPNGPKTGQMEVKWTLKQVKSRSNRGQNVPKTGQMEANVPKTGQMDPKTGRMDGRLEAASPSPIVSSRGRHIPTFRGLSSAPVVEVLVQIDTHSLLRMCLQSCPKPSALRSDMPTWPQGHVSAHFLDGWRKVAG